MTPRKLSLIAATALLMAAAQAGAWGNSCKHSAQREASIERGDAARVEVIAFGGDLLIEPASGPTIQAQGRACASSKDYLEQTNIRAIRDNDVIRVFVEVPQNMSGIGNAYATQELSVKIPPAMPVSVTDTSGDATIDGVAVVSVTDTSGDLLIRHVQTDVEIRDSSGQLRVEDAAAKVAITDSSGDIAIDGAREVLIRSDSSGDIRIEGVSGNVLIENDSSGDITVEDVGGDMTLLADSSGEVRIGEVRGKVSVPHYKK
jgi:virulence-associated protein VagC